MKNIKFTVRRVRGKLSIRVRLWKLSLGLDIPSVQPA
jgi:hypothetical protein